MTCIVGIRKGKDVYLGADSLSSNHHTKWVMAEPKVFKKGDFVYGVTGSWRLMQLLDCYFVPPHEKARRICFCLYVY